MRPEAFNLSLDYSLDYPRFSESSIRAVLVYCLYRACRECKSYRLLEFWNINQFSLEVHVFAHFSGRVKLRRASRVRVSASVYGAPLCYWAGFCHGICFRKCSLCYHTGAFWQVNGPEGPEIFLREFQSTSGPPHIIYMSFQFIFSLLVLLYSIIIHEISHGYAALALGDRTAEYEGRLTLNPIPHIDLVGTIILPVLSFLLPGSLLFGWAKPVPFNPHNLRNQRWGEAIVAAAGPLSNIILALIFGLFIRLYLIPAGLVDGAMSQLCQTIVLVNVTLAIFNLVPMPPLDGSKIITAILPQGWMKVRQSIERFGFVGVFIFLIFIWQFFAPLIPWLFKLITGLSS